MRNWWIDKRREREHREANAPLYQDDCWIPSSITCCPSYSGTCIPSQTSFTITTPVFSTPVVMDPDNVSNVPMNLDPDLVYRPSAIGISLVAEYWFAPDGVNRGHVPGVLDVYEVKEPTCKTD